MPQSKNADKFGWLLNHFRAIGRVPLLAACFVAAVLPSAPATAQVISAHGDWAALRFGEQCEARSGALRVQRGRPPAIVGLTVGAAGGQGRFYVRLSRVPRAASTAILTIGGQPFLLGVRGQWAWERDAKQGAAIMAAARSSTGMRLESRDAGGRRFVDRYSLAGAATAIDAAAAACALAGKSR